MIGGQLPTYAVFDDYRYSQRIAVVVRWFLLATFLILHNYRPDLTVDYLPINGLALTLAGLNAYVHWRIWQGRPITWRYVLALSVTDLVFISVGIGITTGFRHTYFPLYYPALLGLSLVATSWRVSFGAATVVAAVSAGMSLTLGDTPDFAIKEEKILFTRIAVMYAVVAVMYAVVAAGYLIVRIETGRRHEAVTAEREQATRNLELQEKAQQAELAAQEERGRIAREIHDGIAQSIYALSLNLETAVDLAERRRDDLHAQLQKLVPLAKKTLLETRHYIYDLKPLLSGDSALMATAENQVKEFQTVAGTPVELTTEGTQSEVPVAVATGSYRILQEALANVLKHAQASKVNVSLAFEPGWVRLSVEDDGVGFQIDGVRPGMGLENMRQRAEELQGSFEISGVPGQGTKVEVRLPLQEGKT